VKVLGELQTMKNSLGSDDMLLERLGDVLGEFSDDVDEVCSCANHGVHQPSNQTLVRNNLS